jgi:PAS domain S-box-containing protein
MVCGGILYYADQIPWIQNVLSQTPIYVARYSTHRILSLIPVAYAAYVFRFYGGVVTVVFIGLALLPRALFISRVPEDIAEIIAFLLIGLLVTWLIDRQQQTVHRLEKIQLELTDSLQTVKNQSQQLAPYYEISTIFYQTSDENEIAKDALNRVLRVAGAEGGWIYLKEKTGDLALVACRGILPKFVSDAKRIKPGDNPDGKAAQSGAPVVVRAGSSDFEQGLRKPENVWMVAAVPLRGKTGIVGTLSILTTEQQCSREQLQALTGFGTRIGIAIDRARLDQEEKAITEQLRLSEERYRGLFENASEAIFVCSSTGRIISVNKAAEDLTGYTYDELTNQTMHQLFPGISWEMTEKVLFENAGSITLGKTEELRLRRKDGGEAFIELRVSPVLKNGQGIGFQAIARDVTEEKQLQQNMQYYITQITKAQEDERLRISRDLHDETAQVLASLSRDVDYIISSDATLSESTIARLKKLHEMAESALEGVRRFSQDLRPSILDDLGLVSALEWLGTNLETGHGVAVTVNITGDERRLASDKELAVFRIAQEAIGNVRKHSKASAVEMTLDFGEDALTLIIKDNGQGFSMPQRASDLALSGKLGIVGMRERARLVDGTLIVQSEVGKGTEVILRVPA